MTGSKFLPHDTHVSAARAQISVVFLCISWSLTPYLFKTLGTKTSMSWIAGTSKLNSVTSSLYISPSCIGGHWNAQAICFNRIGQEFCLHMMYKQAPPRACFLIVFLFLNLGCLNAASNNVATSSVILVGKPWTPQIFLVSFTHFNPLAESCCVLLSTPQAFKWVFILAPKILVRGPEGGQ